MFCFPEILLAAVGGFVFPLGWAALAVWAGTVLGSAVAFQFGRLLLRSQIRRCLDSGGRRGNKGFRGRGAAALRKLDVALRHGSSSLGPRLSSSSSSSSSLPPGDDDWGPFILVVLIRLPYIPLVWVNYLLSATDSLPFRTYVGATALGVVPGSVFYAYMGAGVGDIQAYINGDGGAGGKAAIELTIAGWVAVAVGFAATWRYARKRLATIDGLDTLLIGDRASGEEGAEEEDEEDRDEEEGVGAAALAMSPHSSRGARRGLGGD